MPNISLKIFILKGYRREISRVTVGYMPLRYYEQIPR